MSKKRNLITHPSISKTWGNLIVDERGDFSETVRRLVRENHELEPFDSEMDLYRYNPLDPGIHTPPSTRAHEGCAALPINGSKNGKSLIVAKLAIFLGAGFLCLAFSSQFGSPRNAADWISAGVGTALVAYGFLRNHR